MTSGIECGFSTLAGHAVVAHDVVWAMLKTLREGADLASAPPMGKGVTEADAVV